MSEFNISSDGGKSYKKVVSTNLEFSSMIQAKELRIGNWISYNDASYQIISIFLNGASIGSQIRPEEDLTPIELTPEILEKCGVIKDGQLTFGYLFDKEKGLFYYNTPTVIVKYLHQLQNLYFALTGKELEINL
jgi:hypothetical protein